MKKEFHYKLKMKLKNSELDIESSDKSWIEETLAVFISLANDDQKLDDAVEKLNSLIEQVKGIKTE